MDIVDHQTRSRMMSGIKGRNTKPEVCIRRFLHAQGFRFRLHVSNLSGHPDIVLPKYKLCIFVHGCFWHRHEGCRYATNPASNPEFWQEKFAANVRRDMKVEAELEAAGWRVCVIWSCQLDDSSLQQLVQTIRNGDDDGLSPGME